MKILYLHNSSYNSEKANLHQVKSMCKAMSEEGYEVLLSLLDDKRTDLDSFDKSIEGYLIHARKKKIKSKLSKYFQAKIIKETVLNVKPDLIYLRSLLLLYQTKRLNIPTIIELHNNQLHQGSDILDSYWRHVLINASRSDIIKKVVCISQALSDYWIDQGIPKNKVVTAHDGIDHQQFAEKIPKDNARKKLNLPSGKKIVTYLGRLYRNRKIENILSVAKFYPDVLFLIVGGPEEDVNRLKEIKKRQNLNNIHFTGQVSHDQVTTYLYASDVLLALWSSEVNTIDYCSPLKLFEYMAAEKVIVAHGFPTILEVLADQQNAIICKPDSVTDLKEKIGLALGYDYPNKLSKNARNVVFQDYTWKKRVQNIFNNLDTKDYSAISKHHN